MFPSLVILEPETNDGFRPDGPVQVTDIPPDQVQIDDAPDRIQINPQYLGWAANSEVVITKVTILGANRVVAYRIVGWSAKQGLLNAVKVQDEKAT